MSGLPQDPDTSDPLPDLIVPLPPEILAMMASFEAAPAEESESAEEAIPDLGFAAPMLDAQALVDGESDGGETLLVLQRGGATLTLAPVLDLTATTALHAALLAQRGTPLTVDASQVKRLGGQCLQLLISAGLTWKADGVSIALAAPSEAFGRDLALLGLRETELFEEAA